MGFEFRKVVEEPLVDTFKTGIYHKVLSIVLRLENPSSMLVTLERKVI